MDPLSDIIGLLRPHAAMAKPITGRGSWGVRYSAYGKPGFAIILEGGAWLALEQAEPVRLARGDFIILPATPAFALYSDPDAERLHIEPVHEAVRHGDPEGEPDFRSLGGSFEIERVNAALLLPLLPRMIHVRAAEGDTGRLSRIIDLIADECFADRPGKDTILTRLLEVMLVECLRWPGADQRFLSQGLLTGMRDPALARAVRAVHSDVRAAWTVAGLAKLAGMSRSAFASRFSESFGCGPMEYLSRWRMTLAQDALSRGGKSLDRLADEIGYESASAFSTAFRRRIGCAPRAFARAQQDGAATLR